MALLPGGGQVPQYQRRYNGNIIRTHLSRRNTRREPASDREPRAGDHDDQRQPKLVTLIRQARRCEPSEVDVRHGAIGVVHDHHHGRRESEDEDE